MASPQGGSAMAAPHPKADVRIILSYIIGPCSKLADGTYSTLRPAARRHLPGVRSRPTAAPPRRRMDTGKAAMLHPRHRKSVVEGKSESVRVILGGSRHIKTKNIMN